MLSVTAVKEEPTLTNKTVQKDKLVKAFYP